MILDAHVHFYDPHRPQGIPHPLPHRTVLYRTSLPEQLQRIAAPLGVSGVIAIECSHWLEDNQWLLDLATREPLIRGVVGNIDPVAENFAELLAPLAAQPTFRGLRIRPAQPLDYGHTRLRSNLAHLAHLGLTADFLVGMAEIHEVARLAAQVPGLSVMLDHFGHVPIDGREPEERWREAMRQLGNFPNVFCKVSCLTALAVMQPAPTELAYYQPTLDFLWDTFGAQRLVFGSNWPPCDEFGGYAPQVALTEAYLRTRGSEARENVMWRNAERFYLRAR